MSLPWHHCHGRLHSYPRSARGFFIAATHGLLKRQLQGITQVGATGRPTTTTAAAAKDIAENVAENVTKTATAEATGSAASLTIHTGMAELVVGSTLLLIGEHFVGFLGFLELGQGFLVIRVAIRMVFHGKPSIGLFQILLAGIF